jgi:uncharacterized membrane protein YkgB
MAHDLPLRVSNGAIILWQGVRIFTQPQRGEWLLPLAAHTVPQLPSLMGNSPHRFARVLGAAETVLAVWLLSGRSPRAAGVALTVFGSATFSLLFTVPGMREEGSVWEPSQEGTAIAKDLWMIGSGLALAAGAAD